MSKGRAIAKYSLVGALTALYGCSVAVAKKQPETPNVDWRRQAIVAAALSAATWVVAVL